MPDNTHSPGGVFLSYAREDTDAARRIAEAMRAFGVDAWFDQSELRGGDVWDATIKKRIRECALFVPLISRQTQARSEGYFRREWKLAVERTHDMAGGRVFVVPVVIDDTPETEALVPEEFLRFQWTRLPHGEPTPEFVAQVKRLLEAPRKATLKPDLPRPPTLPPEFRQAARKTEDRGQTTEVSRGGRKSGIPGWFLGVTVAVVVGAGAGFVFLRQPAPPVAAPTVATPSLSPSPSTPPPRVADKSIAVLPFTNMSEDKDNAFFADGVHEDILTNLALIRELRVVSRTSVQSYRGTAKPMKQIASELGVTYILEGSVRRVGNKVRVTGQLIHAATDEHVWAQTYDRDLTDIFSIQSELSQQIAGALKAALSPEEKIFIARKPTTVSAAYDEYLKGRTTRNRSPTGSKAALASAEQSFQQAVNLDPEFAVAWGELAVVHALRIFWGHDVSPARRARGEEAIARAVRLAPEAPEVIRLAGTYAYYAHRDYAKATEQYEKVLRLQPNDPTGYMSLGLIQRRQGRWAESIINLRKAVELDPANVTYVRNLLSSARYGRRWDEARAMQQRLVALLPGQLREQCFMAQLDWEQTGSTQAVDQLMAALPAADRESELGRFFRAAWALNRDDYEEFKRLDALQPAYPDEVAPVLSAITAATYHYSRGDQAAARARIEPFVAAARAQVLSEPDNFRAVGTLGALEFFLGNTAEALRLARQSVDMMPESKDALDGPNGRYYLAAGYALAGEKDRALAELARLFTLPGGTNVHATRADPAFFRLRSDPRFEALLNDPKNNQPLF
jgi:TolB-like protein/cytochrome c-type biogenesis protein CcmH/NrfG